MLDPPRAALHRLDLNHDALPIEVFLIRHRTLPVSFEEPLTAGHIISSLLNKQVVNARCIRAERDDSLAAFLLLAHHLERQRHDLVLSARLLLL